MKRRGRIIPNGVSLEKHENDTVVFFTDRGKNIELIPPSNSPHLKRPDFIMDKIEWEMKSPKQLSKVVVERAFHKALKQSCNVIIDLRHAHNGSEEIVINHLQKCFFTSKRAKHLLVITKQQELLDFK